MRRSLALQPDDAENASGAGRQSHFRHEGSPDRQDAQRGGSLRQLGGVGMLLRHADEFNLTGEQEEQLNQLRLTHELEKVDLQAALKKAKITFRALARDHDAAESDIMDAIDKIAFHEANLRKMRYRHLKAAHGVLGEDQRNSLKSYHKQHMREKLKSFRDGRRGPSA